MQHTKNFLPLTQEKEEEEQKVVAHNWLKT